MRIYGLCISALLITLALMQQTTFSLAADITLGNSEKFESTAVKGVIAEFGKWMERAEYQVEVGKGPVDRWEMTPHGLAHVTGAYRTTITYGVYSRTLTIHNNSRDTVDAWGLIDSQTLNAAAQIKNAKSKPEWASNNNYSVGYCAVEPASAAIPAGKKQEFILRIGVLVGNWDADAFDEKERAVVNDIRDKAKFGWIALPSAKEILNGDNTVSVKSASLQPVMLIMGDAASRIVTRLTPNGQTNLSVPIGTYRIWYVYLDNPIMLYEGRDVVVAANGSTINIPECPPVPTSSPASLPNSAMKINPKDGAEMVLISAGDFLMGTSEKEVTEWLKTYPFNLHNLSRDMFDDQMPQRKVYLDAYYMYKTEVTVAQYRSFCTATQREFPLHDTPTWGWIDTHPMVNVSWLDAKAYSDWAGVKLPTEAQWEKAARGTEGGIYPWGNTWKGNECSNAVSVASLGKTSPVGHFQTDVSPYGCLDMAGNVWEWCADWYGKDYYKNAPIKNPTGPTAGEEVPLGYVTLKETRVLRGGNWLCNLPIPFRTASRMKQSPDIGLTWYGFRCAMPSPKP